MDSGSGGRLWTWDDVRSFLAATFGGVGDDAVAIAPIVNGDEKVPLEVRRIEAHGASWLVLSVHVGSMRGLAPLELLANNARSTVGSFGTREGRLVTRQTLPLAGLTASALGDAIRELAALVAWCRRRVRDLAP